MKTGGIEFIGANKRKQNFKICGNADLYAESIVEITKIRGKGPPHRDRNSTLNSEKPRKCFVTCPRPSSKATVESS